MTTNQTGFGKGCLLRRPALVLPLFFHNGKVDGSCNYIHFKEEDEW